jgi:hypothetical protein
MVDGTPILDIKPYIPYDVIPSDYMLPMATSSDGVPLISKKLKVPSWIVDADIPMQHVRILPAVRQQLHTILTRGLMKFCNSVEEFSELTAQVLRQDIRGVHQGRGRVVGKVEAVGGEEEQEHQESVYHCRLDSVLLKFRTTATGIEVIDAEYTNDNV